ncbi:hypothetical protein SU69_00025 [Thermosipho melanesiensis]|uniref:Uncharacterized protein n=2 Tax=Thermosipho melanesiensis TaxID=46541 RepID=A0ABM6GGI9_9BACT|nr:hypothetical protein [Thermosipho melanesiensis]APT74786.1 hypothetical protein BW47_00025 [Thermosipho melanesiensis]OOC38488.1 hypothetical protein SU68_00025 [Thermosipho melanesiensis]OOC40292.1 hypothetical protein SU70_00025 [Thermosipho melanesiensis]OOC40556.1 hypothetical protein SU69_00025 [Thermosipho melanesiensis]OOC44403.1 hypothetical protein SU71_00025 [Thermosipho melanesiensis]
MFKHAKIIVMDEPISQLDELTVDEIFENFLDFLKDKTVLIITHRVSNKKFFDRIIELKDGTIIKEEKF